MTNKEQLILLKLANDLFWDASATMDTDDALGIAIDELHDMLNMHEVDGITDIDGSKRYIATTAFRDAII